MRFSALGNTVTAILLVAATIVLAPYLGAQNLQIIWEWWLRLPPAWRRD